MTKRARKREKAGRVTDVDGYKTEKRASGSIRRTTASLGKGDIPLIHTAVKKRWPVPRGRRKSLVDMLTDVALEESEESANKIQAARTVLTMEAQNQKDEHLIFQHENAQPQLHVHAAVDPEQCRTDILAAIDAEVERRELPPGDEASDNGDSTRHHGNGAGSSKTS